MTQDPRRAANAVFGSSSQDGGPSQPLCELSFGLSAPRRHRVKRDTRAPQVGWEGSRGWRWEGRRFCEAWYLFPLVWGITCRMGGCKTVQSMKIRVVGHEECCWVRLGLP